MSISAASSSYYTPATTSSDYTTGSDRIPKKSLGQDDFFSLLSTQLSAQDPLEPMDDTDFIAQMSSFSTLEMMNNMTSSILALGVQQSYLNAQTLLGRTVTVTDSDGNKITGTASALKTADDGSTNVVIDGVEYPASSVTGVSLSGETTTDGTTDETSSEG